MKKIFLLACLFCLNTAAAYAACPSTSGAGFAAMIAMKILPDEITMTGASCCEPQIAEKIKYVNAGKFCGPNAQIDAYNASAGNSTRTNYFMGYTLGCSSNTKFGYVRGTNVTTTTQNCCNCSGDTCVNYTRKFTTYSFYFWSTLPCDPEYNYCINKGWSCANGDAVALQVEICDVEGFPTGSTVICGDAGTAAKIDSGEIDGQVFENPDCGCNLSEDEVFDMCDQIDEVKSKCDDCSTKDIDNDGVNDCDDWCPDTPSGSTVSEHGCPENDPDGDGVLYGIDQCPDTPPNTQVDAWGCPIEQNPDSDVDGDGVPDTEDNCPYEGGTVDANGCPINNPQPEPDPDGGDQDNDNALLEGIIGWLKKLVGVTDDVGDKVDDVGNNIQEFKNAFDEFTDTEGVLTDLPEDDDFNGNLLEDFEEIDLESDFMSDFLGGLLQNNAFIQQITGSTLTASGACSLSGSISVLGRSMTIDFSICEYDLTVFRAMILMIAGLTGFFIVFRKG